jgi:hypothetical protein
MGMEGRQKKSDRGEQHKELERECRQNINNHLVVFQVVFCDSLPCADQFVIDNEAKCCGSKEYVEQTENFGDVVEDQMRPKMFSA